MLFKHFSTLILVITIMANIANCQPKIQQTSVRTPTDVKIDGNLSEWNDKLQAHNNIDGLWYTISNDDDNLYLSIIAPYKYACEKVLTGGITLTISNSIGKKRVKDQTNKSVLFPLLNNGQISYFKLAARSFTNIRNDNNEKQRDSLLKSINQQANSIMKKIQTTGLLAIKNQTISVNNETGELQLGTQFNKKMDFICEFKLPLKYIGLSINTPQAFSYNIKLNGYHETRVIDYSVAAPTPKPGVNLRPSAQGLDYPTDFWGEYTLETK